MDSTKLIKNGRRTALISFFGGTVITLLFFLTNAVGLAFLGLTYTFIIGVINLIVFGQIIFKSYKDKQHKKQLLQTAGVMLLNIPVMIIYCWIAIILLNTLRITFLNSTSTQLENIKIDGCEDKYIDKLKAGQSKTIWLHIPGDCGVSITYKLKGQTITEEVTGYVSNENGFIMTFKIGTNQKPYDRDL